MRAKKSQMTLDELKNHLAELKEQLEIEKVKVEIEKVQLDKDLLDARLYRAEMIKKIQMVEASTLHEAVKDTVDRVEKTEPAEKIVTKAVEITNPVKPESVIKEPPKQIKPVRPPEPPKPKEFVCNAGFKIGRDHGCFGICTNLCQGATPETFEHCAAELEKHNAMKDAEVEEILRRMEYEYQRGVSAYETVLDDENAAEAENVTEEPQEAVEKQEVKPEMDTEPAKSKISLRRRQAPKKVVLDEIQNEPGWSKQVAEVITDFLNDNAKKFESINDEDLQVTEDDLRSILDNIQSDENFEQDYDFTDIIESVSIDQQIVDAIN